MSEPNGEFLGLRPAQDAGGEFPACPPVDQQEIDETARFTRREFGKRVGKIAAAAFIGTTLGGRLGYEAQRVYTQEHWPPNDPEIKPAAGSENIQPGGSEYLLFLGYGQYDGASPSRELFEAMGKERATWWMKCPSQGFTPQDLAPEIIEYIRERRPKELNLVGVSMGTVVALESMRSAVMMNNRSRGPNPGSTQSEPLEMPKINYLIAYSSPADINDAMQGELANMVVNLADTLGYKGDYAGKLLYTLCDKFAKGQIDLARPDRGAQAFLDCLEVTNDHCPPKLCMSQLAILSRFNIRSQAERYQDVLDPGLKFVYISAASDSIVKDEQSDNGYVSGLKSIGVTDFESLSTDQDHANTAASAEVFGRWMAENAGSSLLADTMPGNFSGGMINRDST